MDKTLSITEAARNFSDVVNRAYYRGETTVLLRSGQPVAKISPLGPVDCTGDCTGASLANRLGMLEHLSLSEAGTFASDIEAARSELNKPPSPSWD